MAVEQQGRVRVESGQKRIRVYLGGEVIADSRRVKLVWEKPYYPVYYFPGDDVRADVLVDTGGTYRSPSRGTAAVATVKAGPAEAPDAARVWRNAAIEELEDHVSFAWDAMEAWFEEDEEVFVHARDPYTRVDILQSSRHVTVVIDGVTVADSHQPRLLFETGLPARYYLPKTDVRLDLLTSTATVTECPYKGTASYWSVDTGGTIHEDLVWSYRTPVLEAIKISGYLCFYNEKVDIYVDGQLEERPTTVFS